MRIRDNVCENKEAYSAEQKKRVESVFLLISTTTEAKDLLKAIRQEVLGLREVFMSPQEVAERSSAKSLFDARMQATVYYTLKNIEGYQRHGWRKLVDGGEATDA